MQKKTIRFDLLEPRQLFTVTIQGVQPAALDQPRTNAFVRIPGETLPMSADLGFGQGVSFNIEAFYDTGASGVLLSSQTAGLLTGVQNPGVPQQYWNGDPVVFSDVGVAGSDNFYVSQPIDVGLANYNQGDPNLDLDNENTYQTVYNQVFGPVRTQIGPVDAPDNPLLEGLDVFGTPLMQNKVVVLDPKPVNTFFDTMRTYVYNPGTPWHPTTEETDPGIVPVSHHIKLSYGDFSRFTKVTPTGAPGPTLATNPFIGSNPVRALDGLPSDGTPGVTVAYGSSSTTASFLLDTGAAASIISSHTALGAGVRYRSGFGPQPEGSSTTPTLETTSGATIPNQFTLSIGGIGGTVKLAGFFLDSMTLQTQEGDPIVFQGAPVLVGDISALDDKGTPSTADDQLLTLDGIFGMNYLVASCNLDEGGAGGFPSIFDLTANAFDWAVYNPVNATLGLELANPSPNPRVLDQLFDVDGNEQLFYVQFSKNVGASLQDSDITVKNLTTNFTLPGGYITHAWDATLNTATFHFPGYPDGYLPDGNYRATIAAANVNDGTYPMEADYNHDFFFLNGDVTRDRKVDTKDFNILAKNFGTSSGAVFTQGDLNYDQTIDSLDFVKFVNQYGKSLPAAAASLASVPASNETVALQKSSDVQTTLRPTVYLSPGLIFDNVNTTAASNAMHSTLPVASSIFSASRIEDDRVRMDLLS